MKKFLALIVTICAIISVTDSYAVVDKKELVLTLETMSSPSAFKAFKKASSDVQYENLKSLLSQMEEVYKTCSTLEDFYKFRTSLYIIKQLKYKAKLRNTSQTYINDLINRLDIKSLESMRILKDLERSAAKAEKNKCN